MRGFNKSGDIKCSMQLKLCSDLYVSHHAVSVVESDRTPPAVKTPQNLLILPGQITAIAGNWGETPLFLWTPVRTSRPFSVFTVPRTPGPS